MKGPDFGRFGGIVRHSILIGGAMIARSDVHSQITPDLAGQFSQGHILQHGDIFSDEGHSSEPRENHGITQRRHGHIFERPAKVRSSHSPHPSIHSFTPNSFDSGFLGTNGTTPEIIGSNHLPSRDGYDFFPPTTHDVREGGKVISKFISQAARAREGETVDAGLMRELNILEYQFRRITSLPPADQQVVVASFFNIIGELDPPPPPPDNWLADATPEQREKIDWALGLLAEGGISVGVGMAIVRREYERKEFKKVSSLLFALATLVSACGMNAVETATALLPNSQPMTTEQAPTLVNPNVSVATETPPPNSIPPGDPVTYLGGGSGGQEISCDATAGTLVDRFRTPAGSRIPNELMTLHSADTTLWSADELSSLTDGQGNSIAPVVEEIQRSIVAIDPEADVTNVVSGEGYVLVVTKKGKYVWAIDRNGAPQSRPDVITGTKGFRIIPDPPPGIEGDKRYAVSGGCGVLGVYKDGNMIAVYKPIADKWELVNPPPSESATPVELASAIPLLATPELIATPAEAAPFIDVTLGNGERFTIPADAIPELVMPTTFYALDGEIIPESEVSKWADFRYISETTDSHQFMKYHLTNVVNLTIPWIVSVDGEPTRYYTRIGTKDPQGNWHTYIVYLGTDSPDDEIGVRDRNGFSGQPVSGYKDNLIPGQLMQIEFIHDPPQDYVGPDTFPVKKVHVAQKFDAFLDRLVAAMRSRDSFPEEAEGIIPANTLTLP